jgi:predicted acetyltransferase
MDLEIRAITEQEIPAFGKAVERAFGEHWNEKDWKAEHNVFELDRSLAAFESGEIVGTTGICSLILTIPGGTVPMAGVTAVGVQPTHRRRGILTRLMRRQLDDVRDKGEAIAGLWASESSIYGRFGYGMAASVADLAIERQRSSFARPHEPSGRLRLVDKDEAAKELPAVLARIVSTRPGMWARNEAWWTHTLADLERWREGASALFFALHESAAGIDGYVMYRVKRDWDGALPASTIRVRELMAETREAYADIWRFALDIDLTERLEAWPRPVDEPIFWMLAEPRRLSVKVHDGMWLRLVDLPAALSARRYSGEDRLVLEVIDEFCPWNAGRFELDARPDGAECRPTHREADVLVDTASLAAAYLGGVRFSVLGRAGRAEGDPAALGRADRLFAWEPVPWCHQVF